MIYAIISFFIVLFFGIKRYKKQNKQYTYKKDDMTISSTTPYDFHLIKIGFKRVD